MILPSDYEKWVPVIVNYSCKTVGVSIAWTIQRVLVSFHSAVRGAQILSFGVLGWMKVLGMLEGDFLVLANSGYATLAGVGIALTGFGWQIRNGFQLPFPLNILLLPVTLIEWTLMYFANS